LQAIACKVTATVRTAINKLKLQTFGNREWNSVLNNKPTQPPTPYQIVTEPNRFGHRPNHVASTAPGSCE